MIQIVLNDGTKKRFTNKVIGIDPKDIAYQHKLTKDEEGKKLVNNSGNWEYEKTIPEKDISYLKSKIIALQMTIDAGNKNDFDMTSQETELQQLKDELASREEK